MHVKKWNRMQNAADLGCIYQCDEYACTLHMILLRAHFSQNVKYWYEIRDVLVPFFCARCEKLVPIFTVWNLQSVKFAVRQSSFPFLNFHIILNMTWQLRVNFSLFCSCLREKRHSLLESLCFLKKFQLPDCC